MGEKLSLVFAMRLRHQVEGMTRNRLALKKEMKRIANHLAKKKYGMKKSKPENSQRHHYFKTPQHHAGWWAFKIIIIKQIWTEVAVFRIAAVKTRQEVDHCRLQYFFCPRPPAASRKKFWKAKDRVKKEQLYCLPLNNKQRGGDSLPDLILPQRVMQAMPFFQSWLL